MGVPRLGVRPFHRRHLQPLMATSPVLLLSSLGFGPTDSLYLVLVGMFRLNGNTSSMKKSAHSSGRELDRISSRRSCSTVDKMVQIHAFGV